MASIFRDKTGIWHIKYKDPFGKWKKKSCGPDATFAEAELLRNKHISEEFNRRHEIQIRPVSNDLSERLDFYREHEIPRSTTGRPKSKKSIIRYQAIPDRFKTWCGSKGYRTYSDITPGRCRDFFDVLQDNKFKASTISKYRQILIAFFKWSAAQHLCQSVPMDLIKNPKRENKLPRFFSLDELGKIFGEARPPYLNIFKFLYLTGMRIGEIGNAEWGHFLEPVALLKIPVMEGNKTKREETIPLNSSALKILAEQRSATGHQRYMFLNLNGRKLDNENIRRALGWVLKKHNIANASPHTFRHTTASHLAIDGVSLYIIRDILRHASIRETECYAHLSKEATRAAIDRLSVA
jgi:integrase/recombinase XerC